MPSGSLSGNLRRLRRQAGLSQVETARASGMSQPAIARFESGLQVPTEMQVRALCRAYRVTPAIRRELANAARDLRSESTATRPVLIKGTGWTIQARIGRIEQASTLIRDFQPLIIPGLLQIEEYMRAVFSQRMTADDRERAIAERLKRQRNLRREQQVRWVIPEGALLWQVGGPQVMAAQLNRIAKATTGQPVGIIPWTTPVDVFPVHGWTVYDQATAVVGTYAGTAFMSGPDVTALAERFEALERLAVYGAEAAQVITAVADRYRSLT